MEKEVVLFVSLAMLLSIVSLYGCIEKTEVVMCSSPYVLIGERCCADFDSDLVCDDEEAGCGDGVCEPEAENCTTCWKDCGACKRIVYVYVPRNFTLAELTRDLNDLTRDGLKFRRDASDPNNVAEFFFYDRFVPRYFADFMGVVYKPLYGSRWVVLGSIINTGYYVNDSASLLRYVNFSSWYLIHAVKDSEAAGYEARISSGNATKDYPTQPTGWQKEFRYSEWDFRNYTKQEQVIYDNASVVGDRMVESVYASITMYNVTYKYHEYDAEEGGVKEAFKDVEEKRLDYIHTMSLVCARNLVVTLYGYDYDGGYEGIAPDLLLGQIDKNRASLMGSAGRIKQLCDMKYRDKVFIP
jgi:hypothetical protein